MTTEAWLWPAGLGLLGAVFGSFIATLAIRWPQDRSALSGRSACDACDKPLRPHELVPLASYFLQRGRCRRCGGRIAPSHVLTELAGALVGVSAGLAAPGVEGAAGAMFGWLLLALAAVDLAAFWLPDALTLPLAGTGIATGALGLLPPLSERLIGGLAGFAALWLVATLYRTLRGRDGLGGGDPKLFGGIGLWLGWHALPNVLLIGCGLGLATVAAARLAGSALAASDRLPFGVMLAAGAWAVWLLQAG
jgi:leader peptidase (prepilin peptidase) / N-methyltransferase